MGANQSFENFELWFRGLRLQTVGCSDSQPNDTLHNGTQHNDIKYYDTQHNDLQHEDTKHNDIQHFDTQQNDIQRKKTLNIMTRHNDI